jgi:hypothetical protein
MDANRRPDVTSSKYEGSVDKGICIALSCIGVWPLPIPIVEHEPRRGDGGGKLAHDRREREH